MRAKQQSSNALGMYSSTELSFSALTGYVSDFPLTPHPSPSRHSPLPAAMAASQDTESASAVVDGDCLLHDARNLLGTLGLYCDLLSVPGVLQPQHRQYAEYLRLVGSRSGALIERLFEQLGSREVQAAHAHPARRTMDPGSPAWLVAPAPRPLPQEFTPQQVSLRKIVERCHGLLNRVSGGILVEVSYGEAAALPVRVAEDLIERILVNLVRNAAAALSDPTTLAAERPQVIRVEVGELGNGIGAPRSWPFRQVRLTVKDTGCGMAPTQVEQLLSGSAPCANTHGIGFKAVRELVAASHGDLRMTSTPSVGTRVQIEWPIAPVSLTQTPEFRREPAQPAGNVGRSTPVSIPSALHSGTGIGAQTRGIKSAPNKERWIPC